MRIRISLINMTIMIMIAGVSGGEYHFLLLYTVGYLFNLLGLCVRNTYGVTEDVATFVWYFGALYLYVSPPQCISPPHPIYIPAPSPPPPLQFG